MKAWIDGDYLVISGTSSQEFQDWSKVKLFERDCLMIRKARFGGELVSKRDNQLFIRISGHKKYSKTLFYAEHGENMELAAEKADDYAILVHVRTTNKLFCSMLYHRLK